MVILKSLCWASCPLGLGALTDSTQKIVVFAPWSSSSQLHLLVLAKGLKTSPGEVPNSPSHQTSQGREATVGSVAQAQDETSRVHKWKWAFPGNRVTFNFPQINPEYPQPC